MPKKAKNNIPTDLKSVERRGHILPLFCALAWAGAVTLLIWEPPVSAHPGLPIGPVLVAQPVANHDDPYAVSGPAFGEQPTSPRTYIWLIPRSWYDPMIQRVASDHDVDPALVKAMVQAESAFDPLAVSEDGARGLMQLLPETAARFRVRDLHNPYLNLQAGVRYLRSLLDEFGGDVRLAVAAYNAGENAVRRHQGVPPYRETQRYLDKVLGLYRAYREPA